MAREEVIQQGRIQMVPAGTLPRYFHLHRQPAYPHLHALVSQLAARPILCVLAAAEVLFTH